MSSRRSTRAASSRASSRAGSVAGSDVGAVTPRRSTRNHPEASPLPPLAPRENTSYGSNIAALPTDIKRKGHEHDLTETLTGILGTVQENIQSQFENLDIEPPEPLAGNIDQTGNQGLGRTPGWAHSKNRARSTSVTSTPGNDNSASFQDETGIYGEATFSEDLVTSPPKARKARSAAGRNNAGFNAILEEPDTAAIEPNAAAVMEPEMTGMEPDMVVMESNVEAMDPIPLRMQISRKFEIVYAGIGGLPTYLFDNFHPASQHFSPHRAFFVFLLVVAFLSLFKVVPVPDTTSISQQVPSWISFPIAHPLAYFNERAISALHSRITVVEKDLIRMKENPVLSKEALEEGLRHILPADLYLPKEDGEARLPSNFFNSLARKFSPSQDNSKSWKEFMAQNEAKVKALLAESSGDLWAQHAQEALKDGGVLVSRADVIKMIHKKWDESQSLIKEELKKELEKLADALQQSNQGAITRSEVLAISKEVFDDIYKQLQLKAFAQSQDSEQAAYYRLHRPNHFSFGLGAVVIPTLTSPTYDFRLQRAWLPKRILLWLAGYSLPTPNPPAEALTKWDEAGECWCSPAEGAGAGVQLGVLLAHDLYPKEVIIEHIPKSGTLDPGSTPRDMELLAMIEGENNRHIVGKLFRTIFPGVSETTLDRSYILIGKWTYDIDWHNHLQRFEPQIDLQHLGISTRQLVVRARNNWGDSEYTCLYRVRVHGEIAH